MMKSVVLLAAVITLASAANFRPYNEPLKRFSNANLQVNFYSLAGNSTGTLLKKAFFNPVVDGQAPGGLSALYILNTKKYFEPGAAFYKYLAPDGTADFYVQVEMGNSGANSTVTTGIPTYTGPDFINAPCTQSDPSLCIPRTILKYKSYFAAFVTVLITIDKGVVQKVEWNWDDESSRCGGCEDTCIDKHFCTVDCTDQPASTEVGAGLCDFKIYVAWIGTDADGQYCTSSNTMFSKFTALGVSNIMTQAKDGVSNIASATEDKLTTSAAAAQDKIPGN
mmetsp:Transcript_28752/g.66349  ORF Transcript_28752/g.66349 Transcript_28752/m.66349 type:complete len:280 (+) Transcript_28752:35-874(+)